jgi:hypothetical protein
LEGGVEEVTQMIESVEVKYQRYLAEVTLKEIAVCDSVELEMLLAVDWIVDDTETEMIAEELHDTGGSEVVYYFEKVEEVVVEEIYDE